MNLREALRAKGPLSKKARLQLGVAAAMDM